MNKTIYVADPALWAAFGRLAESRGLSVSAELGRLIRAEVESAPPVPPYHPPNLHRVHDRHAADDTPKAKRGRPRVYLTKPKGKP